MKDLDLLRRRLDVTVNAVEVGDQIEVGTSKTHKRRSVPFPSGLTVPLARLCEDKGPEQPLFADRLGGHLRRTRTNESSRGWFSQAVRRADVPPLTRHHLRRTAASLAVQVGANVKAVQRMLGHAPAAMTLDVYADPFDDDLNAVAERLDEGLTRSNVSQLWITEGA